MNSITESFRINEQIFESFSPSNRFSLKLFNVIGSILEICLSSRLFLSPLTNDWISVLKK